MKQIRRVCLISVHSGLVILESYGYPGGAGFWRDMYAYDHEGD